MYQGIFNIVVVLTRMLAGWYVYQLFAIAGDVVQ